MIKRILAMALAFVMLLGMMPVTAQAAGDGKETAVVGKVNFIVKDWNNNNVTMSMTLNERKNGANTVNKSWDVAIKDGVGSIELTAAELAGLTVGARLDCDPVAEEPYNYKWNTGKGEVRTYTYISGAIKKNGSENPGAEVISETATNGFEFTFNCIVDTDYVPVDPDPEPGFQNVNVLLPDYSDYVTVSLKMTGVTVLEADAKAALAAKGYYNVTFVEESVDGVLTTWSNYLTMASYTTTPDGEDETVEATIQYTVDNGETVVATGETVEISPELISYPTADLTAPRGYKIVWTDGTVVEKDGVYTILVEVELIPKDVVVSYICDDKTIDTETITVDGSVEVIDVEDVTIPEGYKLVENDFNGVISDDGTKYRAMFEVEKIMRDVVVSYVCGDETIDTETVNVHVIIDPLTTNELKNIPEGYRVVEDSNNGVIILNPVNGEYRATFMIEKAEKAVKVTFVCDGKFVGEPVMVTVDSSKTVIAPEAVEKIIPEGYRLTNNKNNGVIVEGSGEYGATFEIESLTKDVIILFKDNDKIVGESDTLTVHVDTTEIDVADVTIPEGYMLVKNEENGKIVVFNGDDCAFFYVKEVEFVESVSKDIGALSLDKNGVEDGIIKDRITVTTHVWSDGSVTVEEAEVKAALRKMGYDVTLKSNVLVGGWVEVYVDYINEVVVSFYDGKDFLPETVTVIVDCDAKVVPFDAVEIPEGYRLTNNSGNGAIGYDEELGKNRATLFVAELLADEVKQIAVLSEDHVISTYIEVANYVWADGTVTVDEAEAIAALKEQGYDNIVLKSNVLDNGILWVTSYIGSSTKEVIVSFYDGKEFMDETVTVTVAWDAKFVSAEAIEVPFRYELAENSNNGAISESAEYDKEGNELLVNRATFFVQLAECTPVYRMYNPYTLEDLFVNEDERELLTAAGWEDKGFVWNAATSGTEVYRMYNPNGDFHIYTMDQHEIETMKAAGWSVDGVATYSADAKNGVAIRRLFNPNVNPGTTCYHYYAIEGSAVIDELVDGGWVLEGIAWYAYSIDEK